MRLLTCMLALLAGCAAPQRPNLADEVYAAKETYLACLYEVRERHVDRITLDETRPTTREIGRLLGVAGRAADSHSDSTFAICEDARGMMRWYLAQCGIDAGTFHELEH